jgi:hypothetical protein
MGTVFLARDPSLDRLVAIKVLPEEIDSDELRDRFQREGRAAARLKHANIVTIFETGEYDGHPFIAMEYIEGETLAEVIKQQRPLSIAQKLSIMIDVCAGLHYAHRAGIVHRDVKPANIMLEDGTVKILDFGVARLGASTMTQTGAMVGTLNYMAPEQMHGVPVDARADIFSTGAVFYELLTYRRAFPGDSHAAVIHRIVSGTIVPIETLCPDVDPAIAPVIHRCLEGDPDQRWQDLEIVRRRLAAIRQRVAAEDAVESDDEPAQRDTAATVTIPREPTPPAPPSPRPPHRDVARQQVLQIRAAQIEEHLERARQAFERRDYDAALDACRRAMVLDPDNAAALAFEEQVMTALADAHSLATRAAPTPSDVPRPDGQITSGADGAPAARSRLAAFTLAAFVVALVIAGLLLNAPSARYPTATPSPPPSTPSEPSSTVPPPQSDVAVASRAPGLYVRRDAKKSECLTSIVEEVGNPELHLAQVKSGCLSHDAPAGYGPLKFTDISTDCPVCN